MADETPDLRDEYRGHQTIAIVVSFAVLSLSTVLLRCYTRFFLLKAHGLDDIFIVIAMVSIYKIHLFGIADTLTR